MSHYQPSIEEVNSDGFDSLYGVLVEIKNLLRELVKEKESSPIQ